MGHLYHGYVSHNQRVLFKSCAMATSKKIRHMKKIDLFLEFLHSWIDGHWWIDIGFEKHIKQLKKKTLVVPLCLYHYSPKIKHWLSYIKSSGCPIMII